MRLITILTVLLACGCGDDTTTGGTGGDTTDTDSTIIRLNEVDYLNSRIEIYNGTSATVDISSYYFCARLSYEQLSDATLVSGSLNLAPGEYVVLQTGISLSTTGSDFGLYSSTAFASSSAIVDFVQWGTSGNPRESVAEDAGLWTAGEFVSTVSSGQSIAYQTGTGSSAWSAATPSLGSAN